MKANRTGIALMLSALAPLALAGEPSPHGMGRVAFPDEAWVVNAKKDLGAKGDGVTDDTEALQKGLDISCGLNAKQTQVLYLPNGKYLVSRTLVNDKEGGWIGWALYSGWQEKGRAGKP
jgi:hypothetical protein